MDRVRFGRALGYGARHAAKSLAKAVDAAAAPNPARTAAAPEAAATVRAAEDTAFSANGEAFPVQSSRRTAGQTGTVSQVQSGVRQDVASERPTQTRAGVRQGKTHASHLRHVWSPLAKFSSVVWLQVSGTFFAFVAAFLSQGLWRTRGAVHLPWNSPEAEKLYLHAAAFVIFAYFAVSSFVRAQKRQRR